MLSERASKRNFGMNEKLTTYLRETYPDIIGDDIYFECGDGWFLIIDSLCSQLQSYFVSTLGGEDKSPPKAVQIKEKFGSLRFYTDAIQGERVYIEAVYASISMAERLSRRTCECCGRPSYPSGEWRIKNFCAWCRTDGWRTFQEEFVQECENYIEEKTKDEEFD
jgi:hypothetical protein